MSVERAVKFIRVEKAKEFESFRRMPKFSHVSLAVINPSPRKKRSPPKEESPNFQLAAVQAKVQTKKYEPKQIPDHLLRAPMDSFTSSPTSKGGRPKSAMGGKGAKSLGGKKNGRLGSAVGAGGMNSESKRAKRAEGNKKVLFVEVKRLLDKAEEASTQPGGNAEIPVIAGYPLTNLADVKTAIRDRRLLRFLCAALTGNRQVQLLLLKQEFIQFIKLMVNSSQQQQLFSEAEIADLFLFFAKKLDVNAS